MEYDYQKYMKKKKMNNLDYFAYLITLLMFLGFIIYGSFGMIVFSYSEGIYFHNIDMAYNMCLISNDLCEISKGGNCSMNTNYRNWHDRYSLNETSSYSDLYIESNDNMRLNFFKFGYFGFLFGYGFCGLFFLSLKFLSELKKGE